MATNFTQLKVRVSQSRVDSIFFYHFIKCLVIMTVHQSMITPTQQNVSSIKLSTELLSMPTSVNSTTSTAPGFISDGRPLPGWVPFYSSFFFFFTSWLTVDNSSRILLSACPSSFLFPSCSFFPCQPSLRWIITVQWHELKNIQLLKQRKPGQREREAKSISSTGVDQVQDTLIVLPF